MAYTAKDIMDLRKRTFAGMSLCKEALENSDGDMDKAIDYINEKSDVISRLHEITGARLVLCKLAFKDAEKSFEKAIELINERGWATDSVESDEAKEGVIGTYVHTLDRKTVALVEVECRTDFVAKNQKFIDFANELAIQAAAMKPEFASKDDIPQEKLDELKELYMKEAKEEGKPENIVEKIVEGKLEKFFAEKCLLSQKWFKDETKTMKNLFDDAVVTMGEPLKIGRIVVVEFGK